VVVALLRRLEGCGKRDPTAGEQADRERSPDGHLRPCTALLRSRLPAVVGSVIFSGRLTIAGRGEHGDMRVRLISSSKRILVSGASRRRGSGGDADELLRVAALPELVGLEAGSLRSRSCAIRVLALGPRSIRRICAGS
jgi:hypothetical protein